MDSGVGMGQETSEGQAQELIRNTTYFPNVKLTVDSEKKVVYATISEEGPYPAADDLIEILRETGANYWIDERLIRKEIKREVCDEPFAVAFIRDTEVNIVIGDNERKAYLVLKSAYGGRELTLEDIEEALALHGVVTGIDRDAIEEALAEGKYNERILCAQAKEPLPGMDAEIYANFRTTFETEPKEIDHDKVDFRELGRFATVSKESVVARKRPATPGEPGVTVTGRPIPAKPGRDIMFGAGKNTHLSYDGVHIIADIDGHPVLKGKTFSVESIYEVPGDVDFSSGNIHFAGSLHITGNVISGFTVTATENIEIDGFVEGSTIEAGGNIVIKGGVQGRGTANIKAGGSVAMLFVEHARVEAGKDIVAGEALHANLSAKEKILINLGKGQACGGALRAGSLVVVRLLGSEMGVPTKVGVGYDPHVKRRLESLKKEKLGLVEYLAKTEGGIAALEECRREGTFTTRRDELYTRLLATRDQLHAQIEQADSELAEIEGDVTKAVAPEVRVHSTVFPNTTITMKGSSLLIKEEWHRATFYEQEGQIKVMPLV
ncbi:MAG TPA: FapA family protein [Syntrophorhabdales bacterium]|nr:FapA family protein [Syntrophorhabdales bacterium]